MTYSGTIVEEAEMALMAGENVDTTGDTEANHNLLASHAEAYLSGLLQDDVVAEYSNYDNTTKAMLSEWAARYAAVTLISYNMITWATNTSIIEAEDLIQIHIYRMERIEQILKEGYAQKQLKVNN